MPTWCVEMLPRRTPTEDTALRPGIGFGLWLVFGGAVLTVLIAAPVALDRRYATRTLAAVAIGLLVLGGGGVAVADQKSKADHRKAVEAAQAQAAAEAKAEAERQAAEDAAEAQRQAAEAAAEAAEAADRELYKVVVTQCASDAYGFSTEAKGKIRNESGKPRTYAIKVRMLNKTGEQVADGQDYVSDLPAGETAAWSASGIGDDIAEREGPTVEVSEY